MTVKTAGLNEAVNRVKVLSNGNPRATRRALTVTVEQIRSDVEKYPPTTAGNRAPYPFYVRGRGMQTSPRHNLNNSEKMSNKWDTTIKDSFARLVNTASYAILVIGRKQTWYHARNGWPNVPSYIKRERGNLIKLFAREYKRAID